jgi:glycosyltransferase involved in cell wall biosynthesis
MKITIISLAYPYPNRGVLPGIERSIEGLSINLKKLGHKVKIVTTYWNGGTRKDYYKGIEILRLKDFIYYFRNFYSILLLNIDVILFGLKLFLPSNFKFFKDSDIVIVYTSTSFTRLFKIKNIPIISMFWHYQSFLYAITRWEFKKNKNIITVSDRSRKDLIKYYGTKKENIKIIPNAVDLKKFNPNNYSKRLREKYGYKLILYSGSMIDRKNIPVLLKAMSYVIKELPSAQLILTGIGPLLESYKELSKALKIQDNSKFLGFINDKELAQYYATSDLFVIPSKFEGFGQIIIEALASGTPVICTNIPPMSNLIEKAGLTFTLNSPKDLSKKIIEFFQNKELYEKLKKNTLNVANKYSWSIIGKKYEKYIKKVIKNRSKEKNY